MSRPTFNRIGTSRNPYQGEYKRVLCVCSAGLLRSPTAAWVLSQEPFNFNTRAIGTTADFALITLDPVLLHWASQIVCMQERQADAVRRYMEEHCPGLKRDIFNLDIPDIYGYRDPELIKLIKEKYEGCQKGKTPDLAETASPS